MDAQTDRRVDKAINAVRTCLDSADMFQSSLMCSYFHPTGFKKIVLPRFRTDLYTTRIHIWDVDPEKAFRGDIHNHAWGFRSLIIRGRIQQRVYSECGETEKNSEKSYRKYHLYQRSSGEKWQITESDPCFLKLERDEWFCRGQSYHLSHRSIHQISSCPLSGASTLVWQDEPIELFSHVYSKQTLNRLHTLEIQRFSEEEFTGHLERSLHDLAHLT